MQVQIIVFSIEFNASLCVSRMKLTQAINYYNCYSTFNVKLFPSRLYFYSTNFFTIKFQGIASFISIAHDLGICVAVSEKVSRHSKPNDFDRIIERLSQKPQARAVVMFVDEDNTRYINYQHTCMVNNL